MRKKKEIKMKTVFYDDFIHFEGEKKIAEENRM